jgi:predicted SAM-dependent methyltransferase
MRVHLCCGDRYLDGYMNVDRVGTSARPPKVKVTLDNYYDHPLHENQEVIYDIYMDLEKSWSFEPETVDEFVMISAFEHFNRESAERILENVYTALKYDGKFRFDFPDIEETVRQYKDRPDYMMRLIYGSQKNDGAYHRWGYTQVSIAEKLMKQNWKSVEFGDIVKHDYPMIGVTATK